MALRRAIFTRASLFARYRFSSSSLSCIHPANDGGNDCDSETTVDLSLEKRSLGNPIGYSSRFRCSQLFGPPMAGFSSCYLSRHMSTDISPTTESAAEDVTDEVPSFQTVAEAALVSSAPAMTEVAIAAADSALPVAALQYLIGNVHVLTGCNWWISIAVTTLLIRGLTVPFAIHQLKSAEKTKHLSPRLADMHREMQQKVTDPLAAAERQQRMLSLYKEYIATMLASFKGLLQGPILFTFYLAITNMVQKVPSFKYGGAYWFTDLTTPDGLFIFPALTAMLLLAITEVQLNVQVGGQMNSAMRYMKNISRVFAILSMYFTMNHSQALCCFWATSNVFSLAYALVCKAPIVKKFLGLPNVAVTQTSETVDSPPSFLEAIKEYGAANRTHTAAATVDDDQRAASAMVCSQRLKISEKKRVKGTKKSKRR